MRETLFILILIIGTSFSQNKWIVYNTSNTGVYNQNIISLVKDKVGILWVLAKGGDLYQYDGQLWKNIKLRILGVPNNSISRIKVDRLNNKYFLTSGYGLIKLDNSNQLQIYNTSNSGIGFNTITDLDFDNQNALWIGTLNGLVKYDGQWTIYRTNNSGIPRNDVKAIAIDSFNTKIVGFDGGHTYISFYNDTVWNNYWTPNGISLGYIRSLFSDSRNTLWIGHLYAISRKIHNNWISNFSGYGVFANCFAEDKTGKIWIGYENVDPTNYHQIMVYDYNRDTFFLPQTYIFYKFPKSIVNTLFCDSMLYVGTSEKGLAIYNDTTIFGNYNISIFDRNSTGIRSNYIKSISVDRNNHYWIGTYDKGLVKHFAHNDTLFWQSFLDNRSIYAVSIDSSENLWVGTYSNGLFFFENNNQYSFTTQNSALPSNSIISINIDRNNTKWIGTGKGLVKIDNQQWTVFTPQNSLLPGNTVGAIVFDNQNNKWIGTENGLARFDGVNWVIYNRTNSPLPDNIILSLEYDKNGIIWIGSWNGGLIKYDGVNWQIFNKDNSPLPSNRIRALKIDKNNVLWIGTESNGLVSFNGQQWQNFNVSNSQLPSNFIYCLSVDNFNNKLIATGNGLAIYREDGVIGVDEKENKVFSDFVLYQNYPNPFNPTTKISWQSPVSSWQTLKVYDVLGTEIATLVDEYKEAGFHQIEFNAVETRRGVSLPSGVYLYQLKVGNYIQTKKMLLIR